MTSKYDSHDPFFSALRVPRQCISMGSWFFITTNRKICSPDRSLWYISVGADRQFFFLVWPQNDFGYFSSIYRRPLKFQLEIVGFMTVIRVWHDYVHKVPVSLHDNLQRQSHESYDPPTSVTWLRLLRQQTNTALPPLWMHKHMRSWLRVLSRLVTSTYAG